jgi:hypothetical protein
MAGAKKGAKKGDTAEFFAEDIARLAKGGKGILGIWDEINKRAESLKVTSGKTVEVLEDQLDIGQQLAENQKDIFANKINIKALVQKHNKAETTAEKKIYKLLLDKARVQNQVQKGASEALTKHQKMMAPLKKWSSMIPGIGSTLVSAFDASDEAFKKGLSGQLDESQKKTTRLGAGFKVVGLAIATYIGKNLLSAMQSTGAGLMDILSRPEFIFFGAESRAIAEEFGNLNETSMKLGANMKMMAFFTGVTAENQAKILGAMAATSDASLETLHAQMLTYRQAGVPFRAIMDDVANNMEFTAKFAKDGGANIFDAAKKARELGLNLGDVASISNSLLDFESSIEKQMEAQVLLGRNINTDRARQLAFTGDTEGLMKEVTKLAGTEAEFNKMGYLQREALAGAIGLSVERMSALVREESKAKKNTDSWFNSTVGIVAAIGGALGMLIGGLTGGAGFARMVGYGMAGVAAGGAIGKLASTFGVPKLADGGIVNTPTLALIGEKGPEAVIPLAEGAGANTLTAAQNKANKLLAAILASSEKQVNRLGDIGTS